MAQDKIKITLRKSTSGSSVKQRAVLHGLGLRRINQTVVKADNACIRGMVVQDQASRRSGGGGLVPRIHMSENDKKPEDSFTGLGDFVLPEGGGEFPAARRTRNGFRQWQDLGAWA